MEKKIRVHRVGSVTTGMAMIIFGVLFILHVCFGLISYEMIFKLWPFILIGLGIEILLSNLSDEKFVYDKAAIFLLIVVTFFAVCMAGIDVAFTHFETELYM